VRFDPLVPPYFRSGIRPHLLCGLIPIPTLPEVASAAVSPAVVWLGGSESLTDNSSQRHLNASEVATGSVLPAARILQDKLKLATIAWLFEQAHQLLLKDDPVAADRCLQKAIGLQSSVEEPGSAVRPTRGWLVLAANSLLKRDFDSCELWLRQTERSLGHQSPGVDSDEFQRAAGDLFAIQACLFAQTSHFQKSASQFMEAFLCHTKAHAWCSAATDLTLRSRLLILESQWTEAEEILQHAEQAALRAEEALSPEQARPDDVDRVLRTIRLDRAFAAKRQRQAFISAFN
jgi:hypothetical protein